MTAESTPGTPGGEPPLEDEPPASDHVTRYDEQHFVTYLRLLDADAAGASPAEVSRIVLGIDPEREPERARRVHRSHLVRARWMTEHGYRDLLAGRTPRD